MDSKEMMEYVKDTIPEDVMHVDEPRADFFGRYTPGIQPFIEQLSEKDLKRFLKCINYVASNYMHMNNLITMGTSVKKYIRKGLSRHQLDKQVSTSIEKLRKLIDKLPEHENILLKISELESIINDSIESLEEPTVFTRPTKKEDFEHGLRECIFIFKIKVSENQITKLRQKLPKPS